MLYKVEGRTRKVTALSLRKADSPMLSTLVLERSTVVKDEQVLKALASILATEEGRFTEVRPEEEKALSGMTSMPSGRVMLVRALVPAKTSSSRKGRKATSRP